MPKRLASSLLAAALVASCSPAPVAPAAEKIAYEPTAPVAKPCPASDPDSVCKADTSNVAADYQKAMQGDYQAQRNTAWSFNGSSPYVEADPVQACAWRKVIMASRPADARFADAEQLRIECSGLKPNDLASADQLSARILSAIA